MTLRSRQWCKESDNRQALYTATNAYNQFQQQAQTGIPENQQAQFKVDVINYVVDGTLPAGNYTPGPDGKLGTITYTPEQLAYIHNVIKVGDDIIKQIPGAKVSPATEKNNSYIPDNTSKQPNDY